MKVMYIGKHATLEYLELLMFHELGHKVFSHSGAYATPNWHESLPRPALPQLEYFPQYDQLTKTYPDLNNIPAELIDPFDLIIVTGGYHDVNVISLNWKKLSKKKVVWRTIGQSTKSTEMALSAYRSQGLKIVRMSPMERKIPSYIGEDAIIRFYQDPDEFKDWNGNDKILINFTQSLKGRRVHCHYDDITNVMKHFPSKVYGTGNEDLGQLNGGSLSYNVMKEKMRDSRAFLYAGTWPSPYTLAFGEAWMTGIPVVAISKDLAEKVQGIPKDLWFEFYEVHELIQNGENGFICETVDETKKYIELLFADYELAKRIGNNGRQTAIHLFSKEVIKNQWKDFFSKL